MTIQYEIYDHSGSALIETEEITLWSRIFEPMNNKTILGLLIFLPYPFLLKLLPLDLMWGEVAMWLLLIFVISWIYFVEKEKLNSIGWKKVTSKTILWGLGLGLLLFILFGVMSTVIQAIGLELNQDMAELFASQPLPVLILIALRAGVVEEVLYRGFAFERINSLTKSKLLAGLVPLIIFMLGHVAWGFGHLIFVFFAGGLLTLTYALKRNLALVIIAHFTVDVIALIVLPLMLGGL